MQKSQEKKKLIIIRRATESHSERMKCANAYTKHEQK